MKQKSLGCLLKHVNVFEQKNDAEKDDLSAIAMCQCHDALIIDSDCLYIRFLTYSSNRYKSLFTVAECALTNSPKGLDTGMFERQMFFYENSDMWAINGVNPMVA